MAGSKVIEVYAVGTPVFIAGELKAHITQVCIANGVTYECVWWREKERKTSWMNAWEVSPTKESELQRIGFGTINARG